MADIERSIAECCKQLRLSSNFAGQAMTQKGDSQQEYLLNLLTNEIEYRLIKRKSTYLNTAGFPRRYSVNEFRTDEVDFPEGVNLESLLHMSTEISVKRSLKTRSLLTKFGTCSIAATGAITT